MKIFLLNYHNNGLNIQVPVLGSAALGIVALILRDKLSRELITLWLSHSDWFVTS